MSGDGPTPFATEPLLGYSMLARLFCRMFGHRWDGSDVYCRCLRCGVYERWPS